MTEETKRLDWIDVAKEIGIALVVLSYACAVCLFVSETASLRVK